MRSFPTLQPLLLSKLQEDLVTVSQDYVDKLRAIYPQVPTNDTAYRVIGMSRKPIGATLDELYVRFMVESYQRAPNQTDLTTGVVQSYHPVQVRFYLSFTIRHLRDDGGTFDQIVYTVGFNHQRVTERGTIQSHPDPYILYDLWERIRADLALTLFDSPDVDPNIIMERTDDPTGTDAVKRPDIG